jgi:hypothetical protein
LPAFALAAILSALLFSTYLPALKLARYRAAALAVLAVVLLLTFTSCGGGGGGGGGTTNPGTPAGTYTLIVTCSGTTVTPAPTTNVTLTVQ